MRSPRILAPAAAPLARLSLAALLAAAGATSGCAPAAQQTPVVAITPPPAPPPEAPEPAPEEPAAKAVPHPLQGIAGVWEDLETMDHHTIVERGGELTVTSIVDAEGQALEIRSVEWKAGVLEWTYHVASTGYTVHFATERLEGDTLWCSWSNAQTSGTQELRRVK